MGRARARTRLDQTACVDVCDEWRTYSAIAKPLPRGACLAPSATWAVEALREPAIVAADVDEVRQGMGIPMGSCRRLDPQIAVNDFIPGARQTYGANPSVKQTPKFPTIDTELHLVRATDVVEVLTYGQSSRSGIISAQSRSFHCADRARDASRDI